MSHKDELIQVSAGLAPDGGGTAVVARMIAETTAQLCRARGHSSRILTLDPGGYSVSGARVEPVLGKTRLASVVLRSQLIGRCRGLIFDHPGPARTQALLPSAVRAPYLVFLYGIDVWRRRFWSATRSLLGANVLIAISEFTRGKALEQMPGLNAIEVLYPALEEHPPTGEVDRSTLERAGRGFLMIVGRMSADERYKGHDELLGAMPKVLHRSPDARLVVVGDGDDRPRLEARALELGLGDAVYFTGFASEATLHELYERAGALVMPSPEEGFGLVYLEAMRAGKACVGARGGAAEEIIVDGETGLLVDRDSDEEIVATCTRLLREPEVAAALGRAGRQRWQDKFRRATFERGLYSHLENLIGSRDVRD